MRRLLGSLVVPLFALVFGACPPQFGGIPCTTADGGDCPSGQVCVDGTCQVGAGSDDGGAPDAGDAGTNPGPDAGRGDGGGDGGTDGGPDAGTPPTFAGVVQLNGGAVPPNTTWVYGVSGSPAFDDAGSLINASFTTTADAGGAWAIGGDASGNPYVFVAQYDLSDTGMMTPASADAFGISSPVQENTLSALNIPIDVETATCFSITVEAALNGGKTTLLLGVGAHVVDIYTGEPFTDANDLSTSVANFDAGGLGFPDSGTPPPTLGLQRVDSVPGVGLSNDWVFAVPAGSTQILTQSGSFAFDLSDSNSQAHKTPEYPAGTCLVGYQEPPGFPGSLSTNAGSVSTSQDVTFSWVNPPPPSTPDAVFMGDMVDIYDGTGKLIYSTPSNQYETSPLELPRSMYFGQSNCAANIPNQGKCTLEVISLFGVVRDSHSTAFEGGASLLSFQTG